jgi:hypothetical protein
LLQQIQRFIKHNPEISINLYTSINDLFNEERSNFQATKSTKSTKSSSSEPKVQNPLVTKTRGRPANKRIKGSFEKGKKKARISG